MNYYIIAGEASGDLHGSNLMTALKKRDPQARFRCWGGDLMARAGGELVKHYRGLAFMGFWEVFINLRVIFRNLRFCKRDLLETNPDVLILIDYPGFNLRMAQFARKHGIRVFYYISPQLWAWRSSRVRIIRECVTRMFVILPFEENFYRSFNYQVDFVGHPLLDIIREKIDGTDRIGFFRRNGLPDRPVIALLPGSRRQEISIMLRRMKEVIDHLEEFQFVIAGAPSIDPQLYSSLLGNQAVPVIFGQTYDLLRYAEAALVTSGTATLETALVGTPEVVCYRGSALSYWIARRIVHVPYISLVNLIMEKEVVRELIQWQLTVSNLVTELRRLFDPAFRTRMNEEFEELRRKLGGEGASSRTADLMIQYLCEK